MTRAWLLTISSGMGPVEVRQFVRMLADWFARELPARGAMLESMVIHGPEEQPSSIDLAVHARRDAVDDLLGTHVLDQPSTRRGKRSRKRWYAGVSLAEMVLAESALVQPNDVIFESCRASGAGGQHVNKTESAVRALHIPSGLRVRVESERSQHQNKQRALEAIANALATQQARQAARARRERRHRALHVERGTTHRVLALERRFTRAWRLTVSLTVRERLGCSVSSPSRSLRFCERDCWCCGTCAHSRVELTVARR